MDCGCFDTTQNLYRDAREFDGRWKFGTSGYHGDTMEPQTTQSRPTLTRL